MGPYIFYRVEDHTSRARYIDGDGLLAEDTDTEVNFRRPDLRLISLVERHLDWGNRDPTPFISMYCEEAVADREADRRVRRGKRDVKIYKIIMPKDKRKRVEYRNVRRLAKELEVDIPEHAWHNSECEYIALNHVPESAVVGSFDL